MGSGTGQAEEYNQGESSELNGDRDRDEELAPLSKVYQLPSFDTVGNRIIRLVKETETDENVRMFSCDLRSILSEAMSLFERGFVDAKVTFPNGRKMKSSEVVRRFGLRKWLSTN